MNNHEKISGKGVSRIMKQLVEDKTLVQYQIPSRSLDGLTIVRHIRKAWMKTYFLADIPEGLPTEKTDPENLDIHFEFTGRDQLKYRFHPNGGRRVKDVIWFQFPKTIERIQQRESFRLQPRSKVKIVLTGDGEPLELSVINLSEGGALTQTPVHGAGFPIDTAVTVGSYLKDLRLVIPFGEKRHTIRINRALVKRTASDAATHRHYFGVQFVDFEKDAQNELTRLIYKLQQDFLQQRLPVKG